MPSMFLFARGRAHFQRVQFLARLESDRFAGCNADLGAGPRIAANTGLAGTDAENAKSAQFDAITGGESLLEALKNRIHRGFSLGAGQARALDYIVNNVLFDQWHNLAAGKWNSCKMPYGIDATGFAPIVEYGKQ